MFKKLIVKLLIGCVQELSKVENGRELSSGSLVLAEVKASFRGLVEICTHC